MSVLNLADSFRAGAALIAGRPNVGKSTLVNRLVGSKVAITSPRAQTTRARIIAILNRERSQITLIDTPGILLAKSSRLSRSISSIAPGAMGYADALIYLTDPTRSDEDDQLIDRLDARRFKGFKALVLNKIDLLSKERLIASLDRLKTRLALFDEIVPVSALKGENLDRLIELIENRLPESEPLYPTDMLTDQPESFFIAEIVREKAIRLLRDELPYAIAVEIIAIEERSENMTYIAGSIIVEKERWKKIVIGKNGETIKKIGSLARRELESILGARIYLDLRAKTRKGWSSDDRAIAEFGYGGLE